MALISCPNCGQSISDIATKCVHCGTSFSNNNTKICPECNTEISGDYDVCPVCGYPLNSDTTNATRPIVDMFEPKEDEIIYIEADNKTNRTKNVVITTLSILLALCIAFGVFAYYSVAKSRKEYRKKYTEVCWDITNGTTSAEKAVKLIRDVWYNTIFEVDNTETDYFTKDSNGNFNRDVTDSILNMMNNQYFLELANELESNRKNVDSLMKELRDYPEGYDKEYETLRDMYNSYNEMIDLATCPSGDLSSYINKYNEAHGKVVEGLETALIYIDKMKKGY